MKNRGAGAFACPTSGASLETLLDKEGDQVDDAAGVAPLVVVPGDHLQQVAIEHFGQLRIDDAAVGVAQHISGDHGVLGVGQDTLESPSGPAFGGGVASCGGGGGFRDGEKTNNETSGVGTRMEKPSNLP